MDGWSWCGVGSREEEKEKATELGYPQRSTSFKHSKSKILSARMLCVLFRRSARELYKTRWWKSAYTSVTETSTQKRFRQFERKTKTGRWDKVFKRYFNLFGLVKDTCLEHLPLILAETLVFGMQPLPCTLSITTKRISQLKTFFYLVIAKMMFRSLKLFTVL